MCWRRRRGHRLRPGLRWTTRWCAARDLGIRIEGLFRRLALGEIHIRPDAGDHSAGADGLSENRLDPVGEIRLDPRLVAGRAAGRKRAAGHALILGREQASTAIDDRHVGRIEGLDARGHQMGDRPDLPRQELTPGVEPGDDGSARLQPARSCARE